jgi:AcrR family transcriptional regulator
MTNKKSIAKLSKGETTRNRILTSAVSEIAKSGFEGLILTTVAKLAGVSRSNLLQHFESRENLIEQTTIFLGTQGRQFTLHYLEYKAKGKNRILVYIQATFEWARVRRGEAVFLIYLINRAGYDKHSNSHIHSIFSTARHRLTMDLLDMSKNLPSRKAEELALQIHTNLLGYIVQLAPMYQHDDLIEFERQCLDVTKMILKESNLL